MKDTFKKIMVTVVTLLAFTLAANATEAPKEESPKINIHLDPALSKSEEIYTKTVAKLAPEQQKALKNLEDIFTQSNEPQLALIAYANEYEACKKIDPEIEKTHAKMMQTFRYRQLDNMRNLLNPYVEARNKINFIDPKLLANHLSYSRSMQTQIVEGMGRLASEIIVKNKDTKKCGELKKELEGKYSEDYIIKASNPPTPFHAINLPGGGSTGCTLGFTHDQNGKHYSIAIVFFADKDHPPSFEISGKIASKDWLPVGEVWVDFGSLNTRFAAHHEKPSPNLIIASMPGTMAVPALWYARDHKIVSGLAEQSGPDTMVAFESDIIPMPELEKMASCIGKNVPELKEPLKKAGFTLAN